jgi:hypothetical protein
MSISRRKFLQAGTLFAISAGVPLKSFAGGRLNTSASNLIPFAGGASAATASLDREAFARHLNTNFVLQHETTRASVRLVEVRDAPRYVKTGTAKKRGECFSLLFLGAANTALRQQTYTVEHGSLGKFALLVVPMGKGRPGASYYEAVFNRL